MSTRKISAEEQKALRNSAKAELSRLEQILSKDDTVQLLDSFKNKFNLCETVYKVILQEHQKEKGNHNGGHLKVEMRQVPHALAFAGFTFDKELLTELFGASSKKGKTVKKLRDAVTHGIDEKAVKEISMRKDELFGYMDAFLNIIKNFD